MALRKCPVCGTELTGNNRQRYCSDTCSKRARRNASKMEPRVEINFANGMEWLAQFIDVKVDGRLKTDQSVRRRTVGV